MADSVDYQGNEDDGESSGEDKTPEDLVEEGREIFKLCQEREADNRRDYVDDIKFGRLGEQWPENVRKSREDAGLPCLTINRIPAFIHQVVNDTRQNKPAITVRPVDSGADRWTAQIIGGGIRHIEQISGADTAYDTSVDCAASGNIGFFRIAIDYAHNDSFDKDIKIHAVPDPGVIYGDPYSFAVDSSDWNDCFVAEWMPVKQFKKKYPKAEVSNFDAVQFAEMGSPWFQNNCVLVMEWWHRDEAEREIVKFADGLVFDADSEEATLKTAVDGPPTERRKTRSYKVTQRFMNGEEIMETIDWPGQYIPVIPVYGETVVVEGKRYLRSLIRDGKDPQKNFNYWRSKASEAAAVVANNPYVGHESAFTGEDAHKWANPNERWGSMSVPDGVDIPQRQGFQGVDPASMNQAALASDDMKDVIGIHDAALGARSNETSGRAINARKTESDVGTFHFTDNLSRAIRWGAIVIIDLMPHVYTPGRFLRVLGQDGVENHVQIGQKQPPAPMPADAASGGPGMSGAPGAVPGAMPGEMPAPQPGMQAGARPEPPDGLPDFSQIYDIALGKYDVVVQPGPGYTTRRQEAADQQMQMVQAFPQLAAICGDLIAKNQDWPGAEEWERRLKKMLPPQLQDHPDGADIPPQLMAQIQQGKQLIQQLSQALQQCQAELQTAKAGHDVEAMKAKIEEMAVKVDMFNAQTKRLEAETKRGDAIVGAFQNAAAAPMGTPGQMPMQG